MTSPLWQVRFSCPAVSAAICAAAFEEEAAAVSWMGQDEDFDWTVELIYEEAPAMAALQKKLKVLENEWDIEISEVSCEPIPEKDWVKDTYQQFPPLKLGCFYIYGSHVEKIPPANMHGILVDAATAFGSGQHGTTAGCLLILDELANLHPRIALDMGCGSGILALAMASLWKSPIMACDNDPEAVRVTQENAILNRLNDHLEAFQSEGFSSASLIEAGPFEIITANILAGPLIDMAASMRQHTTLGGKVILSGLLITQAPQVVIAYANQGFQLITEKPIQEWMTLLMERVR